MLKQATYTKRYIQTFFYTLIGAVYSGGDATPNPKCTPV